MRTLILFFCLLPLSVFAQADTSTVEQYCQVKIEAPLFSGKLVIDVDFGDKRNQYTENILRDENGRTLKFTTLIDALNHMGKQGWILVNAYQANAAGNSPNYYYIMKKRFKKMEL